MHTVDPAKFQSAQKDKKEDDNAVSELSITFAF